MKILAQDENIGLALELDGSAPQFALFNKLRIGAGELMIQHVKSGNDNGVVIAAFAQAIGAMLGASIKAESIGDVLNSKSLAIAIKRNIELGAQAVRDDE